MLEYGQKWLNTVAEFREYGDFPLKAPHKIASTEYKELDTTQRDLRDNERKEGKKWRCNWFITYFVPSFTW
jgi:hypothetical protein